MSYKENISDAHRGEVRKTWHIERAKMETEPYAGILFKQRPNVHVQNAKRRPCVQKRLRKLMKYVKRAWNGYRLGKLKSKQVASNTGNI